MVISTGMATLGEILDAINVIKGVGNKEFILLYCISLYPPKIEDLNLCRLPVLQRASQLPVGFSDHTNTPSAAMVAVALGAKYIETHYPSRAFVEHCKKTVDIVGVNVQRLPIAEWKQRRKFRREWVGDKFLRNP